MGVVVVVGERKKGGEVRKVIVENGSELKNFAVWGGGGGGNGGRRGWGRERNAEGQRKGKRDGRGGKRRESTKNFVVYSVAMIGAEQVIFSFFSSCAEQAF